jgi:hypothetical protein
VRAECGFRLEDDHLASRLREFTRDREADHARAYDCTIDCFRHYLFADFELIDESRPHIIIGAAASQSSALQSPKNSMNICWNPDFSEGAPAFAPVREAARKLRTPAWPGCDDFNRLLAARAIPVVNAAGHAVRFVAQAARTGAFEDKYEPRSFLRGEIQFRAGDWHDVFNALAWLTFPRAKAALNERHYRALERQQASGAGNRAPAQDALTLLDESGVLVVTADVGLGEMLASHAWKELFWSRRAAVARDMRFYLFGHGLGEKMLRPFIGVTGRSLICGVARDFLALPLARQLDVLDTQVAARIGDARNPLTSRDVTPVPLLGIPGWCADNEDERYYDNAAYFRPQRATSANPR